MLAAFPTAVAIYLTKQQSITAAQARGSCHILSTVRKQSEMDADTQLPSSFIVFVLVWRFFLGGGYFVLICLRQGVSV